MRDEDDPGIARAVLGGPLHLRHELRDHVGEDHRDHSHEQHQDDAVLQGDPEESTFLRRRHAGGRDRDRDALQ